MPTKSVTKVAPKAEPDIKTFGGGKPRDLVDAKLIRLVAYLDEEPVPLDFMVRPGHVSNEAIQVIKHRLSGSNNQILMTVMRMIRKMMIDSDGVSVRWNFGDSILEAKKKGEDPSAFRGPDGKIYDLTDTEAIEKFQKIENGSSRRRWHHLMEEDDDLSIEVDDLMEILDWSIAEASNRPT
jgi:hypothetical protein